MAGKVVTKEEFAKKLKAVHGKRYTLVEYVSARKPGKVKCNKCGNIRHSQSISNLLDPNRECQPCSRAKQGATYKSRHDHAWYVKELAKAGPDFQVLGKFAGLSVSIRHRHTCGYEFDRKPSDALKRGYSCRQCAYSKRDDKGFARDLKKKWPSLTHAKVYETRASVLDFTCSACDTQWTEPAYAALNRGCTYCETKARKVKLGKREVVVQGYEHLALAFLLKEGYRPSQIKVSKSDKLPTIRYSHGGKNCHHRPDLWIPDDNLIVEVKSPATLGLVKSRYSDFAGSQAKLLSAVKRKRLEALKQGFRYKVVVFKKGGKRMKLPPRWYNMSLRELQAFA